MKEIISSPVYLKQFDVNKPVRIYTDASKIHGCAYMLTQPTGEFNPNGEEKQGLIHCNSVVAKSEWKGYAPIEVELLAILYAAFECDWYIKGAREVEIRSDHKPLQEIFAKPLHDLSDRSFKIRIQLLDYNLVVNFVPGKKN